MLAKNVNDNVGCQASRVIVDLHREQARSHKKNAVQGNAYTLNSFFIVSLIPPKYLS